jgi:fatty acid desaturase
MKQQRAIAITILLVCLLNFPLLSLFNKAIFVWGIPLIYVYVFSVWTVGIIVIGIIAESKNVEDQTEHE